MEIIFILIPIGIVLLGIAVWAFFWAVKNDQFDDLDGPAYKILFDDPNDQNLREKTKPQTEARHNKSINKSQNDNLTDVNASKKNVSITEKMQQKSK